jgi:ABC-type multidrug transport system ATPase subunit
VTSVSRSDHDDEAPEGTGTGVSAERGPFVEGAAPKRPASTRTTPARAKRQTDAAATPKAPSTTKTTTATSSAETGSAGAAKGTAKGAAKRTAKGAEAASASDDETQTQTPSKRTAASRAASSKAAAVRGEAAKAARTARTSAAATPATRSRAAAAASTKRQTQRVAAALTTETTTAERAGRKQGEATTTGTGSASPVEVDETTRERPAQPTRTAAIVAAATIADDAVAGPGETGPTATVATPAAETPAAPEAPVIEEPAADEVIADALPGAAADTADATGSTVDAPVVPDAPAAGAVAASIAVSAAAAASDVDQAVVVIPAPAPRKPPARKKRTLRVARPAPAPDAPRVLAINGLVKRFGDNTAVDGISLDVRAGSFYGIVGPNGAGKTTTLSMVTGLLRPDAGTVRINDIDAWANPRAAKRATGALPDRLRLFDRLTGAQLLYYAGALRGLDNRTVRERSTELIAAFGLEDAVDRLVADYSAGMTKKIALACAMIHAPRLLVLDEPFESVDPVSAANLTDILERFVGGGGTVLLSSHGMDLIERVCDSAAIIIEGRVLASGTLDEVRVGQTLEDRFVELAGGRKAAEGMEWLHSFSD